MTSFFDFSAATAANKAENAESKATNKPCSTIDSKAGLPRKRSLERSTIKQAYPTCQDANGSASFGGCDIEREAFTTPDLGTEALGSRPFGQPSLRQSTRDSGTRGLSGQVPETQVLEYLGLRSSTCPKGQGPSTPIPTTWKSRVPAAASRRFAPGARPALARAPRNLWERAARWRWRSPPTCKRRPSARGTA